MFTDHFPIIVSTAALVLSLVTLYANVFRSPSMKMILGDRFTVGYEASDILDFHLNVTFVNLGAKPGVVTSMLGEIEELSKHPRTAFFDWKMFLTSKANDKSGDYFEFSGWVEPIVVPPRSAVSKYIGFETRVPFTLYPGKYCFIFRADISPQGQPVLSRRQRFEILPADAETLATHCRADEKGIREHHLQLALDQESQEEASAYTAAVNDRRLLAERRQIH